MDTIKKKKSIVTILATFVLLILSITVFTACGKNDTGHTHTYATEWSKDETNHWYAATCEHTTEKKDLAAHVYDDDNDASCNVCGYERVTITFNISARTYDKTEQGLAAEEYSIKGGVVASVEYKVKGADDTEYSSTAPVKAGVYTVRIKVTGNAEYSDVEATADFTIAKRKLFYGQSFKAADYTNGTIVGVGESYFDGQDFKDTNKIGGDEIYLTITFATNEAGAELVSCTMSGEDADNYFLSDTVKPYLK